MLCNDNYSGSNYCTWIIIIAAIIVVWLLCGNNGCGCGNNYSNGCGC